MEVHARSQAERRNFMLRRFASLLLIVLIVWSPLYAADLPIRRIMLYKHGVGYFERSGNTEGGAEIVLEFKASEMNDVLKSLTLLDRSGGRVSGVSYESSDPINKQLSNFGFSVQPGAGIVEVLDQFKGAKVVVKNQASAVEVRGSILGARRTQQDKSEIQVVTLLLENGEIRTVPIAESTSLRLEDPRQQAELASYLTIVAGGQRRDLRALRIRPGTAKELTVGYVVEAPVWKSSYRMVFDSHKPGEALLQGWAIVDNPSNEDWKDVELSLVSGLPISFTQNLYAPHYMTRPSVPLPFEGAVAPRVYEGAMTDRFEALGDGPRDAKALAMRPSAGLPAGSTGGSAGRFGRTDGTSLNGAAESRMAFAPAPPPAPMATAMADSIAPMTQGVELGDLFEYRVDRRLNIPRHESAMIPFVQSSVAAERVLLYDASGSRQNPFDAVLFKNTSHITLDGGAITVLDGDRYLGEALIETLKPGDSRPVSFAVDLGTRVTTNFDSRTDQYTSIKVHRGIITTTAKNVEVKTYTIRNTDEKARTLILQHPVRGGWHFSPDSAKPEETTAQNYRFRVALPAKETSKLAVREEMEYPATMSLNNLNSDVLALYVHAKALSADAQAKLQAIVTLKNTLAETQNRVTQKQTEINDLRQDQDRLRQNITNLRGLPGMDAQVNSYAAKLASQEKTIESMQTALAAERASSRSTQQELDRAIAALEI